MANRSVLDIILNLQKRGTGATEAERELSGLERTAQGLATVLTAAAVVAAGKMAFELAELGAQAERTETAFVNLSGGTTQAAANLEAMMRATRGAVSETEAMLGANRLMSMGLADSAESLEKNATLAIRLGTAFGRDAQQSIEEWGLLLANLSVQRLDTFGISSGRVRERMAELAEMFPEMSREARFQTATFEQAEIAMARLGDGTADTALQFERLRAQSTDLKTAMGVGLSEGIGQASGAAASFLSVLTDLQTAYTGARREQGGLIQGIGVLVPGFRSLITAVQAVGDVFLETGTGTNAWLRNMNRASDSADGLSGGVRDVSANVRDLNAFLRESSGGMEDFADSAGMSLSAIAALRESMAGAVGAELADYREAQRGLAGELGAAQRELNLLTAAAGEELDPAAAAEYAEQIAEVKGRIGDTRGEMAALEQDTDLAIKKMIFGMMEARLAVDGWTQAEIELATATAESMGLIDRETANAARAMDAALAGFADSAGVEGTVAAIDDITNRLLGIPRDIPVNITIQGMEQLMSIPGMTPQEARGIMRGEEIPQFQTGTLSARGGLAVVGEAGPELVRLSPGSRVFSTNETRQMFDQRQFNRGGDTIVVQDQGAMAVWLERRRQEQTEAAVAGGM